MSRTFAHPPPLHLTLLAALVATGSVTLAGPLNPPAGPITSTSKTLTEVEPRTAINTTNTPGNASAVFLVSQPGSYYLTGNITGVANKAVIYINSSNVTIDLNGFTIQGGTSAVSTGAVAAVTIRNGMVASTSSYGLQLANCTGASVERVTVQSAAAPWSAINAGVGARIVNCAAIQCGNGIVASTGSIVSNCVARSCTSSAFYASGDGVTFDSCTASGNGLHGFSSSGVKGTRVVGCTSSENTDTGFFLGEESFITECTSSRNGSFGMRISANSIARANLVVSNGTVTSASGISVSSSGALIEGNRCIANAGNGISTASGALDCVIIGNWCRGNTLANYSVGAGNEFALVITNPGTTFTGATPFSNFSY